MSKIIMIEDILEFIRKKSITSKKEIRKKFQFNNSNLNRKLHSLRKHGLIYTENELVKAI